MELLLGTIISALATSFSLGLLELITPEKFYRYLMILGVYPLSLLGLWYLNFGGFPIFVCAGAASALALLFLRVVERLSQPQVQQLPRRY
jgi:membrane protein implicated in regulation of membrane protease activity